MVCQAMGVEWKPYGIKLSWFASLILVLGIQTCWSLNFEGLALFAFRERVEYDPHGFFANWNPDDNDPCMWSGVHCVDGRVQMLDLNGLSLEGELAPELGKLSHLKSLVLHDNLFSGIIPKEIGGLARLEMLDLRNNNLSGTVPAEIGRLQSLKSLLICNNNFKGDIPLELEKLNFLSELQLDEDLTFIVPSWIGRVNRKFAHCIGQSSLNQLNEADSFITPVKGKLLQYLTVLPLYGRIRFKSGKGFSQSPPYNSNDNLPGANKMNMVQDTENLVNSGRRRLLQQSSNLAVISASIGATPEQIIIVPYNRSSGSFPAVPNGKKAPLQPGPSPSEPSPQQQNNISGSNSQSLGSVDKGTNPKTSSGGTWKYVVGTSGGALFVIFAAAMLFMYRSRAVSTIGPWKTGLSGQLQKAFVTGVPKLNRCELEAACEDFSNIIDTIDGCTLYKGTLSSGVEIAVAATAVSSAKDWTKLSELAYRKKIDTLSRVNHKNFVNLIGYCEEDEPFTRMMVFEYAPNGTLSEHLHVKEVEHLDWNSRTRIIMGTAYCLQYMHDLNPPVAHTNLVSNAIFLTDDYAAKIAEVVFWTEASSKSKDNEENESQHSELPPFSDPETNVYNFGILLLEIISGKHPSSNEEGPLVNWAAEYMNKSVNCIVDPTLKSFKDSELHIICKVIQDCIQLDARKRPTIKEIVSRLREVISLTPEAATPRLSPLWWAELEILSAEAA